MSSSKDDYPTLLDAMFGNRSAISRHKRMKGFQRRKPDKYFKKGYKRRG